MPDIYGMETDVEKIARLALEADQEQRRTDRWKASAKRWRDIAFAVNAAAAEAIENSAARVAAAVAAGRQEERAIHASTFWADRLTEGGR